MKHLFFVAVAICILSGTSLTANAQKYFKFENSASMDAEALVSQPSEAIPTIQYTVAAPAVKKSNTIPSKVMMLTENCKKLQFKFAQLMNKEVENITNFALFTFLNDWWKTRYRYGGTGRSGIDCSAFTGLLFSTVYAFKLPRTAREQYRASKRVALKDMVEGDLVFFNTTGGVSHVGVYLGDGYFTHSSSSQGVTISSLTETYYKNKFIGGGRVELPSNAEGMSSVNTDALSMVN